MDSLASNAVADSISGAFLGRLFVWIFGLSSVYKQKKFACSPSHFNNLNAASSGVHLVWYCGSRDNSLIETRVPLNF